MGSNPIPGAIIKRIMNTTFLGDLVEQKAILKFMQYGLNISKPITNTVYDLILDGNKLYKIQCKKANFKDDYITFKVCSDLYDNKHGRGRKSHDYHGLIDYFYSYCFELDRHYLVPIEKAGTSLFTIRLNQPKSTYKNMNLEKDFLFENQIENLTA